MVSDTHRLSGCELQGETELWKQLWGDHRCIFDNKLTGNATRGTDLHFHSAVGSLNGLEESSWVLNPPCSINQTSSRRTSILFPSQTLPNLLSSIVFLNHLHPTRLLLKGKWGKIKFFLSSTNRLWYISWELKGLLICSNNSTFSWMFWAVQKFAGYSRFTTFKDLAEPLKPSQGALVIEIKNCFLFKAFLLSCCQTSKNVR